MPILDFKELSAARTPSPAGENLEGLARELGRRLGLSPNWSGRGSDQGCDLLFIERRKGALGSEDVRWLVSCKDFANSGRSVSEQDVGQVSDKVIQHSADGFLLVTTTTASTGLKAMLDGIQANGRTKTQVWDRHELEDMLLQDAHLDLTKRYLPQSHAAFRRLGGLPQVLEALEVLVPGPVHAKLMQVVETYQVGETWLTGERIWPHDRESSRVIDLAIAALLERGNSIEAAQTLSSGGIEFDAFEATLKTLATFRPVQAQELCRQLVAADRDSNGSALYAFRFYVDTFEPNNEDQIALAVELPEEDLQELYTDEISQFIDQEFSVEPSKYEAWNHLDTLASHTNIEEVYASDISLSASSDRSKIEFTASLRVSVSLFYDGDKSGNAPSFPGSATGHISAQGMFLDEVTVDTDSFYE